MTRSKPNLNRINKIIKSFQLRSVIRPEFPLLLLFNIVRKIV